MRNAPDNLISVFKGLAVVFAGLLVAGCLSAKTAPIEEAAPATPAPEPVAPVEPVVEAPAPAPEPEPEPEPEELTSWTVSSGENLWGISALEEVYNVPEKWPLIYKSNLDQIEDPDLIFPGQVLDIPRGYTQADSDAAVEHARTRGAWAVGPIEASDLEYLKSSE